MQKQENFINHHKMETWVRFDAIYINGGMVDEINLVFQTNKKIYGIQSAVLM